MKKEKYKVYTYSYEYSQYIVVQELSDRDLPIDHGFIAKPKKLKFDKKMKKKYNVE